MAKFLHQFPHNLRFSNNELFKDLEVSGFCIYRSTAVAIEGLNYGVRPIHFSRYVGDGLDPLAITNLSNESFSHSSQLISYLQHFDESNNNPIEPSLEEMRYAFRSYFEPLNPKVIED